MIYKVIVRIILKLHSFLYNLAGFFVVKAEKGIHPKHRLTNYHKFFIDNIELENTVLDIGCGNGELAFDLTQKARKVIGIDISPEKIRVARQRFQTNNVEYLIGDVTKSLPDQKFDILILSNVLEHIEDRIEFLNKIKNLGDKILVRVPMINRDWITLYKKELGLPWKLHNGHFIEYTLETFKQELNQAGLVIQNCSIQFGEIWAVVNMI